MGIVWIVSKIIEQFLFSWLRSVWSWMEFKVQIMNTWCILVTEAVTASNLITIVSLVSEIWRTTDRHTHTDRLKHTDYLDSSMLSFSKSFPKSLWLWKIKNFIPKVRWNCKSVWSGFCLSVCIHCMPGENYRTHLRSTCCCVPCPRACDVSGALISSLCVWILPSIQQMRVLLPCGPRRQAGDFWC